MVIVGSVDGNRIWGNELRLTLSRVEWSPDGKFIVFITQDAQAILYSCDGSRIRTISMPAQDAGSLSTISVVGFHWYDNTGPPTRSHGNVESAPNCCIAFSDGMVQLTRGAEATGLSSAATQILDSGMKIKSLRWNPDGTVVALAGVIRQEGQGRSSGDDAKGEAKGSSRPTKQINVIKFYDAFGQLLRLLKVPGENLSGLSWEGSGLRLGLSVDAFIFFANVRPSYTWAYFGNTMAYTYYRPERKETALVLWDLTTNESQVKFLPSVRALKASGD
jgi:WD repeat-containing protein 35